MGNYTVIFERHVDLTNVQEVINLADQHWYIHKTDPNYTMMAFMHREMEFYANEDDIARYAEAINGMNGDIVISSYFKHNDSSLVY